MTSSNQTTLEIELNGSKRAYHPGDKVIGTVHLTLTTDSAVGTLNVRLSGRSESRILQSNGQSTSDFQGITQHVNLNQTVYKGHYTHKKGVLSWPFEFHLPELADHRGVKQKWRNRDGFAAFTGEQQPMPLPTSFWFTESKSGQNWQAFNFYTIEAEAIPPDAFSFQKLRTFRSSVPIKILPVPPLELLDLEDPTQRRGHTQGFSVRTLRLLPGHTGALTAIQKTRSVLNPQSLPKFSFDIDVSYSATLQVHHPSPIPFIVAAIPKLDPKSTTIQPTMQTFYRYPPLKLKRFELTLRATTMCRCPSILSDVVASTTHDIPLANCHLDDILLGMRSLAWDQKNRVEEETPTSLDLGKECNVVLKGDPRSSTVRSDKSSNKDLAQREELRGHIALPFTTYNVSRAYHLTWKIDFECAGEKLTLSGTSQEQIDVIGHVVESPAAYDESITLPSDTMWIELPADDVQVSDGINGTGTSRRGSSQSREHLPVYSELPATLETSIQRTSLRSRLKS